MTDELASEWRQYLKSSPPLHEYSDWISVKAMEHGVDFFDLAMWLILGVERPATASKVRISDG